MQTNKSTGEFN